MPTQSLAGPLLNASYLSRGYTTPPTVNEFGSSSGPPVEVCSLDTAQGWYAFPV